VSGARTRQSTGTTSAGRPGIARLTWRESRWIGYLIAPDLVATVAHAVSYDFGDRVETAIADRTYPGIVVALDRERDVALLKLDAIVSGATPFSLAARRPEPGARWSSTFQFAGYEIQAEGVVLGIASGPQPHPELILQSNTVLLPGASGCPIVVDGAVVGHLRASRSSESGGAQPQLLAVLAESIADGVALMPTATEPRAVQTNDHAI